MALQQNQPVVEGAVAAPAISYRPDLTPMAYFDAKGDPGSVSQRWKQWVRRFKCYIDAMNITSNKQKRALLIYQAGPDVQDIFETLEETGPDGDYNTALAKLNNYFLPKKNVAYEIYVFRQVKQDVNESIDSYCTRLRKLSATCKFKNVDFEIKTQIIQACTSQRLRRRALREPDISLADLLLYGRTLERSEQEAQSMERSSELPSADDVVNSVKTFSLQSKSHASKSRQKYSSQKPKNLRANPQKVASTSKTCFSCGHPYPHQNRCPANNASCN